MIGWIARKIRGRWELMKARNQLRGILDHDQIGRYLGLCLFPAAFYFGAGVLPDYSKGRVREAYREREQLRTEIQRGGDNEEEQQEARPETQSNNPVR